MSSSVEESNDDDFYTTKQKYLDRTISRDLETASSQDSIEESSLPINTNINQAQLTCFQSFNVPIETISPICTNENDLWIEFTEKYLNFNASISLFLPDENKKHRGLRLVPVNDKYAIHNGEVVFKIDREILNKLKLDFIAIQFTDDLENKNEEMDDAYQRNTVRLLIKIYDNYENLVTSFKSEIIRNKNFKTLVSEDISILQIIRDRRTPTKYQIRLKNRVPYFPDELEINIEGYNKNFIPTTERNFPIQELIIFYHGKIKCTPSNTSIICKKFKKEYLPKEIHKNAFIEKTKMEVDQRVKDFDILTQTNQTDLIPESSQRTKDSSTLIPESKETKEMCLVINQIEFDNKELKSRESHSKKEIEEIKDVFSKTLNYDVHILKDLTTLNLKDEINNKLDNFDENHDHIVVFVFSHGDNNMFHTRDGSIKYDEFVKIFFRQQIYDKPKIFFISCCQGKKVNTLNKSLIPEGIIEKESANNENFSKIKNIPEYSEVFMGFSSVPDYYSLRVNSVTPYIQILLAVIRDTPALPVTEIQNRTQCRVNWRDCFTIPCVYHCLTKEIYFKRKEND